MFFLPIVMIRTLVLLLPVMVVCIIATPAALPANLSPRDNSQDFVSVVNLGEYCMIFPRKISKTSNGVPVITGNSTYCTPGIRTSKKHGKIPTDIWAFHKFQKGTKNRHRFAQLSGCLKPGLPPPFDHLNFDPPTAAVPSIRFDSTHGGHPKGSMCIGYKNYVEILNPNDNGQACIRCCDDPKGCSDTTNPSLQGDCFEVVHGYYCS